jgi:hypothetical protein
MAESTTKLFWGDGEHKDENPQDFMNAVEHSFTSKHNLTNTNRLRQFTLYLKSGSIAKQWWNSLPVEGKDMWAHLQDQFEAKWLEKAVMVKTVEEKQALLEGTKLSSEDIGKQVKVNGMEEFAHIVWADKIECLASMVPDTNGLLIPTICQTMPKVLRKVIGMGHTTWPTFCAAVRDTSLAEIEDAKEQENEQKQIQEDLKKVQEQTMWMKALENTFQHANLGPAAPTPRQNPPCNYSPQTTCRTQTNKPGATTHSAHNPDPHQPHTNQCNLHQPLTNQHDPMQTEWQM